MATDRGRVPAPPLRVVFLVPRRADGGHRDELWRWARARWERLFPDWPIVEGHHDAGPFNRSAAINLASDLADDDGRWDVAVVIDSDVFLRASVVREAVERAAETGLVTWPHTRWRGLSELWTKRVVDGGHDFGEEIDHDDMDVLVERTNAISWSCCIAIPRAAWDRLGGFDERFRGWGFEDMAFQSAVVGLLGFERIPAADPGAAGFGRTDVYHLWHSRSAERIRNGEPAITATAAYVQNARLGRRYMLALRRDYGLHERVYPGWRDDGERDRDIANLERDELKFAGLARRHGLPDWSDWWPTLEELVDGAKAAKLAETPEVAVIVRTGGELETWPARREYLRRSLASLVERVHGRIGRKVVYSDWADSVSDELRAIAEASGFYVVGNRHHGYTESARRLWRYLDTRVSEPYVFLAEDDFVYLRDVELAPMVETLRRTTRLRQIALLRGPVFPRERSGEGILGWPEDGFERLEQDNPDRARLEHRLFWTMNPSVVSRTIASTPWPAKRSSERAFGDALTKDPRARFAFWGTGEPWIEHIGETRAATEY